MWFIIALVCVFGAALFCTFWSIPPGPGFIALSLHSVCNLFALVLHSFSTVHYFGSFLHSVCTCFAIVFNVVFELQSNCTRIALALHSFVESRGGHYWLHMFCTLCWTLSAIVLHSFPTLLYLCILCCTQFAFVLQYVLHDFVISPRAIIYCTLFAICVHSLLHSNCIMFALVLHSLVNCPGAIIDCTIC